MVQKVKDLDMSKYQFNAEDVIKNALKIPGVRVERDLFLKKELIKYYPKHVVNEAIDRNPAYAGIEREKINEIAKQVINYETNRVSAISFAAGLPGGIAMAATIPADIAQYFGNVIIAMQKLAYLYGFDSFEGNDTNISDDTLNELLIFLGAMFGVQGAQKGVAYISQCATVRVAKSLSQKALTKTTVYPVVKQIAKVIGVKMTKDIFAKNVAKVVPVIGGVVSGGLTYATFKPSCDRLMNSFKGLNLSDPEFYRNYVEAEFEEADYIEGNFTDIEE